MPEHRVCERCAQPLQSHESISVADVGLRCYRCFNEETAAMMDVEFDNTPLQPVTVSDTDGVEHTFEFRSMLVPTGHALRARECVPEGQDGYELVIRMATVNAIPTTRPTGNAGLEIATTTLPCVLRAVITPWRRFLARARPARRSAGGDLQTRW